MRKAKIICTMGPACREEPVLSRLVEAGMDVARLNFSHGTHEDHLRALGNVRKAADNAACQGYLFAGTTAAAMGAKCTTALQPGVSDDWAVQVNRAIASNVCNLKPADNGKCVEP